MGFQKKDTRSRSEKVDFFEQRFLAEPTLKYNIGLHHKRIRLKVEIFYVESADLGAYILIFRHNL